MSRTGQLAICAVALFCLVSRATPQTARNHISDQQARSTQVRCTLQAESVLWTDHGPNFIKITLENLTDTNLNLKITLELFLSKGMYVDDANKFSAPVDIVHNRPLETRRRSIKGGSADSIVPIPVKIDLGRRATAEFLVDGATTKWNRVISSVWPFSSLTIVPPGHCSLWLEFQDPSGRPVSSNEISISLERTRRTER